MNSEPPAAWTCGHEAGAVCAECYRRLAEKAAALQAQVDKLQDEVDALRGVHW